MTVALVPRVSNTHVAVLGGGLQGCCIALALADRGARVTLYDRNEALMTQAAVVNEGRIHLGYIYAADTTLATARTMIRGALTFAPFVQRYVGLPASALTSPTPTTYVIHRDSRRSVGELAAYLWAVHALVRDAARGHNDAYFGAEIAATPRLWSQAQRARVFDPELAVAAVDTPEIAIDPTVLAAAVRERIKATPAIETRLGRTVTAVEEGRTTLRVVSAGADGPAREDYAHVVNALWDGRLTVDATRGLRPSRPWMHRFKYGVRFHRRAAASLPTVAIMHGPFGDLVAYQSGLTHLTWYPACLEGISNDVTPPEWSRVPADFRAEKVVVETVSALSDIILPLRAYDAATLECEVQGGVILAWGQSDIDDPASELHRRYEIGVNSTGCYHSVDPGKLTMVPYFAGVCADRIVPP
jgi:FAD dependent oxidoreductase